MNMSDNITKFESQAIDPNILSVLDVTTDGKVVKAKDWKSLWECVFNRINNINALCLTVDELRISWKESSEALNETIEEFRAIYDTFKQGMIHYGDDEPTNPHTLFWIKQVSDPSEGTVVTVPILKQAIEDKVVSFTPVTGTELEVPVYKAVALESNSAYLIERFRTKTDVTNLFARTTEQEKDGFGVTQFVIPAETNITMLHARVINNTPGYYTVRTTVMFDGPILFTPLITSYPNTVKWGYYVITGVVNAADKTISIPDGNLTIEFFEVANTDMVKNTNRITSVTLTAAAWKEDSATGAWVQQLTIPNITANSKIDINLTVQQLNIFHQKDITFVVANEDKVVKMYCIGQKPTANYTVQLTITEVKVV